MLTTILSHGTYYRAGDQLSNSNLDLEQKIALINQID